MGVREVMLIAQDSTDYGYDLGLKDGLAHLLDAIVERSAGDPLAASHVRLSPVM